jgi:hypothetical protein
MTSPGFTAEGSLPRSEFHYQQLSKLTGQQIRGTGTPDYGLCLGGCPPGQFCLDGSCFGYFVPQPISCDNAALDKCINQAYQGIRPGILQFALTQCVREYGGGCSPNFELPQCCFPVRGPNGGVCVDLWNDPNNCGTCGNACASCTQGACGCSPPLTVCGNTCVNLDNDPKNCSRCNAACPTIASNSTPICTDGFCDGGFICDPGFTQCSGDTCADLNTDTQHCGACDYVCPNPPNSIPICIGGNCAIQCVSSMGADIQQCDHPNSGPTCPDLLSDSGNCGSCNYSCDEGESCCSGSCTNIATDSSNCGGCGYVCNAGQTCQSGACICPSNQSFCQGQCTDTLNDSSNCGSCGNVCGGGQVCDPGRGVCVCPGGEDLCNGVCTPINVDKKNCGRCGNACTGADTCVNGSCMSPCESCTNCHWDSFNFCWPFGECYLCRCNGRSCLGTDCCNLGCPSGQTNCGGAGCVDTSTNSYNCGSCGNVCVTLWGFTCVGGECVCTDPTNYCSS